MDFKKIMAGWIDERLKAVWLEWKNKQMDGNDEYTDGLIGVYMKNE